MKRVRMLAAAVTATLSLGAASAHAAVVDAVPLRGAVTALSVIPGANHTEIVIAVDGTIDVRDFILTGPHRIVVDLHNARLGFRTSFYDKVDRGGVKDLRVAQWKDDIVRIALELDRSREYTVVHGAGELRVTVSGGGGFATTWHAGTAEAAASEGRTSLAGRTPSTRNPVTGGASTAPAVNHPVVGRDLYTAVAAQQQQQPRTTVTYQDADIREVIAGFAGFSGRTIVVGRDVQGTVTAEIRDQPWDVALQAILTAQGLAAFEDPRTGIITIDSYRNILAKQAVEPLATEQIKINYARAHSLVPTLQALLSRDCGGMEGAPSAPAGGGRATGGVCVVRGSVVADSATNSLLVTDVPSRLDEIMAYVRGLDVRTPQVAIRAKIIFVDRTSLEELGISYDVGTQRQFSNQLVQRIDPSTLAPVDTDGDGIPDSFGGGQTFPSTTNVIDLGGNALSGVADARQRFSNRPALDVIFSTAIGQFDLTVFLAALQRVELIDVQAVPSIVTLDNHQARIVVGQETPVRVIEAATGGAGGGAGGAAFPVATVEFRESGRILTVTPQVTNNRQILMTIEAENSDVQLAAADAGFQINKQEARSRVLVADGETAVIGGLTVTTVTVVKEGIPFLVDLPLIGRLFGRTLTQERKQDLLVLVTPHIVDEGEVAGSRGVR